MHYFIKLILSLSLIFISQISHAIPLNLSNTPLYLGGSIQPNVMVMLDNSGSMKTPMYEASSWRGSVRTGFNNTIDYSGIFDSTKTYQYDSTIPVNSAAYGGLTIDTTKTGAFYETACTPATGDIVCWSGRYLNWLTTRRIDASRSVLIGGKLESRTAFNYGSGYQYKIVANNEHADDTFGGKLSNSDSYSPVPNNETIMVESPADINNGAQMTIYDPYAKLTMAAGTKTIFNNVNTEIGEFGTVNVTPAIDGSKHLTAASWTDVTLSKNYIDPIVIAKPVSFNGGDPSLIRIKDVTANSFKISQQEWPYKDGNHTQEQISYLVVEAGSHTLPGGQRLDADSTSSNKEYVARCSSADLANSDTVNFGSSFPSNPVVIASTTTYNNPGAVNVRVFNISSSDFDLALQQQEDSSIAPLSESIDYIAITAGSLIDVSNGWLLEAGTTGVSVDEAISTINFSSSFSLPPAFIAGMTSMTGTDPAVLRLNDISKTSADIHVEEEASCDSEVAHSNESVAYLALEKSTAALNIALVSTTEPIGLLQEIASDVRLGTSFYRYPPNDGDIYNNVKTDGGTLRFKIPNNPFVKKPSATGGGGYRDLNGYITSPIADIVDSLEHYPLIWGTTPLAENLWEVIQYFEQDTPYYTDVSTGFKDFDVADSSNPERDPYYYANEGSKLWCAKSSVIIFTDGEPYRDAAVPLSVQDYDGDTATNDTSNLVDANAHGRDNLDDVAYWAFCDKNEGTCFDDPSSSSRKAVEGSRDLRADLTGNALDKGQFLKIHTVGFAGSTISPILQDTADNAGGFAYAAEDGKQLKSALTQAFTAAASVSSASSVALNSGSISDSTKLYQARFDANSWTGQLLAYPIKSGGSLDSVIWDAADEIPLAGDRILFTHDGTNGVAFQWTGTEEISASQKTLLANDSDVLDYLRGVQTQEVSAGNGGTFKNRSTLLGDIVHSAPVFVGEPSARYPDNWGSGAAENSSLYSAFKTSNSSRTPLLYVGSNDGFFHAFDVTDGSEKFAYIPNAIFNKLGGLTNSSTPHEYTVDGLSTVVDAYYASSWHTVMVSTLGAGGQGVFAIDVTDPSSFDSEVNASDNVLWEFTDKNDSELGYTFGQPSIVRLQNGKWAAIFSGGYNNTVDNDSDGGTTNDSTTGNAVLYIVDIENGNLIKKFDTQVGSAEDPSGNSRPNGLSTPTIIDIDSDLIADFIYTGDLFGNVWKIDISANGVGSWDFSYKVSSKPAPIFTACHGTTCGSTNIQAITSQVQVTRHPESSGYLVYFGTGKYFEVGDNSSSSEVTQSFYGLWDKAESSLTAFDRGDLLQQEILLEVNQDSFDLRLTTDNAIDWASHDGWYMDLYNTESSNTNNYGERVISNSVIRNERIIFTTLLPLDDPCASGGTGWLMELDLESGARLPYAPFDINNDRNFTTDDYIHIDTNNNGIVDDGEIYAPPSGKKSTVGIIPTPSILNDSLEQTEYKYTSGSSGAIEVTVENPGLNVSGRQSWKQLLFDE